MKTITEYLVNNHIHNIQDVNFAYYTSFDRIKPNDWVIFKTKDTHGGDYIANIKDYTINKTRNNYFDYDCYFEVSTTWQYIQANCTNGFYCNYWVLGEWTDDYKNLVYKFLNSINKESILDNKVVEIGTIDNKLNINIKDEYKK